MVQRNISLSNLPNNKKARIMNIYGGYGFQRRLRVMGIREGEKLKVISRQPFRGPITIEVCGSQVTLGRGMAHRIMVEVIE